MNDDAALLRHYDELSERDRNAVLLRFFEHRRFAEIAAALRLTEDAANVKATRPRGMPGIGWAAAPLALGSRFALAGRAVNHLLFLNAFYRTRR